MYVLQFSGIRDMKLSLPLTHLAMLAAFFYLPFSLINRIRRRCINRNFWVTVGSLLSMFPPLLYSLYVYYKGSHNVADYGNVCFFIFIIFFAIDVGCSIMKDIDAGKKAAIYQELAEKDLLTGCYNRNAYRNDTCDWTDLKDVLLLTFDLNNLKKCNDTLGHNYGDQYITDASAMLKETFSSYGKIYRIGGDEFCIIISDSHKKCDIHSLLDALIEKQQIYNASSECIRMQIACGYAEFDPKTDSNMEDIRIRADKHMYKNKKDLKRIS
jgi:diguanylate cyclase (GGDEF)-like protein